MPTEWILEQFSPFRSIYVSARVVSLPRWKVECLSSLRPRNRVNCPNRKPLGHVKVSAGKNQKRTRARTSKVQEAGSTQKQQNESVLAKNPPSPALPLALPLSLLLALPGLFSPALAVDEPRENSGETPKLLKTVDFGPLMQQVQKAIKSKWQPPVSSKSLKTRVSFMLFKDGRVQGLKTLASSGDKEFDRSALKAVENALDPEGKLCPLPATAPDSIEIEFALDYNVESNVLTPAEQIQLLWKNAVEGQLDKLR